MDKLESYEVKYFRMSNEVQGVWIIPNYEKGNSYVIISWGHNKAMTIQEYKKRYENK